MRERDRPVSEIIFPSPIGELKIVDMLEYYDEPVLYFGESSVGQKYLVMLSKDNTDLREWLIAPVSAIRVTSLEKGELDLHTAFVNIEGGMLWKASQKRGHSMTLDYLESSNLDDSDLPERFVFVETEVTV